MLALPSSTARSRFQADVAWAPRLAGLASGSASARLRLRLSVGWISAWLSAGFRPDFDLASMSHFDLASASFRFGFRLDFDLA